MGISFISALTITTNDIELVTTGPNENNKYAVHVCHSRNHPHHPLMPIISTDFQYDSKEVAEKEVREYIAELTKAIALNIEESNASPTNNDERPTQDTSPPTLG